ncbi:MAG TPA: CDP-diacylglycerol--serine O-phosphatidyltransferase [Methanothermobacter sp.]|uniref:CDP-diacylglycerol--serine O-phosphatidyltransferase n=1 Tax=Methanothermobacter tenebrarum TaxID=680118 RepID=A0ABM7YCJ4_9EURY|nr:archaetidylserine synthase [Methanothermobacter tenebrarum]MDI6881981.1 archaetidylserine synthase [Methanothermobacter sp.]BDH79017.1 CDP-diacylglycerol--serine O-phosphatidyltransferase [Methanothermobacter tenebrarum]HHW16915.1 CDP-diacylglycerol--serine O-phosphatidyltransferase [Methanothermobacter sp.]HOQ20350.1 archaetidylserine synthase [Methanothermobacter sp.]
MRGYEYGIRYYIGVPDLFSIINASLGFLSIIMILEGGMRVACQLMLLAVIFDSVDGWIARRIKRRDEGFGRNVDSLSDIISFGLAPALFIYSTTTFRYINIGVSLLIMTCGILRLSRFNVVANVKKDAFIGLPIPVMAVVVSSLYLSGIFNEHIILIISTIISFMMISSIEYPKINAKNGAIVVILLILTILTGPKLKIFATALLLLVMAYILIPFIIKGLKRDIR